MNSSGSTTTQEHIQPFLQPIFPLSASVAFMIVGYILQRLPSEIGTPVVRLSNDQGGMYHLLSLRSPDGAADYGEFNLSSGRYHLHMPFRPAHQVIDTWPYPRSYVLAAISQHFGLERTAQDIFAALEQTPQETPNPWLGITEQAIGSLMARFLHEPSILIENGNAESTWLKDLPEDCMMAPPFDDSTAARTWRLEWAGHVVFIDSDIVYLPNGHSLGEIPCLVQKAETPLKVVVDRMEGCLRGLEMNG